jgi:hypothetical protein
MWVVEDKELLPRHILVNWLLHLNYHPVLLSNPPCSHNLEQCTLYFFLKTKDELKNMAQVQMASNFALL